MKSSADDDENMTHESDSSDQYSDVVEENGEMSDAVEYSHDERYSSDHLSSSELNLKDLPIGQKLDLLERKQQNRAMSHAEIDSNRSTKVRKLKRKNVEQCEEMNISKRSSKAPVVMKSNRPVSRFRTTVNTPTKPFRDPRFSDISGKLNLDKFHQSYSFLEQQKEQEIISLEKQLKKTRNPEVISVVQETLKKTKQEILERMRGEKLKERLSKVKSVERQKVAQGKKPYFLKKSTVKEIALETRYEELKESGRLNQFLAKKRRKNSAKDRRALPFPRPSDKIS